MAAQSLMRRGFQAHLSYIELTFDLSTSIDFLRRRLFSRATRRRELRDSFGRETLYVGSPKSDHQIRIYQKNKTVVRLKIVLRRPYLRHRKISGIQALRALTGLDLCRLVSFRDIDKVRLRAGLDGVVSGWRRELFLKWPLPVAELISVLKKRWRLDTAEFLIESEIQGKLKTMQEALVY